jgi:hypothetical protein
MAIPAFIKVRLSQNEFMKSSMIFQITNENIVRISALKVYLKFNKKGILVILSTHGKPSLNMQKRLFKLSYI